MPIKRVKAKARRGQITEAAAAEFIQTNCCALRRSPARRLPASLSGKSRAAFLIAFAAQ